MEAGISLDQQHYIDTVENLDIARERSSPQLDNLTPVEHTSLRTLVGRLNWAVQDSSPELSFEMVELSTKFKSGVVNNLLRATKAIKKLQREAFKIFFPSLPLVITNFVKLLCFWMRIMPISMIRVVNLNGKPINYS